MRKLKGVLLAADIELGMRTVWAEARGEEYLGKLAVAHVLVNRWQSPNFPKDDTLGSTCLRHLQFSGWTQSDPNFVSQQRVYWEDQGLLECLKAVVEALTSEDDPTNGACHYHADSILPDWVPQGHTENILIGTHRFYVGLK